MNEKKQALINLIQNSKKIMLVTHRNPDGDALGSILSMYEWLQNNFSDKSIEPLITGKKSDVWSWWKGIENIKWVEDVADHVKNFDLVIFLDSNGNTNFIQFSERFDASILEKVKTVCIDHHASFEGNFDLVIHDVNSAACCQIIADVICEEDTDLTPEIARNLLLGVLFDTGSLKYVGYQNAKVLLTIKRLIEVGKIKQVDLLLAEAEGLDPEIFEIIKGYVANTSNFEINGIPPFNFSYPAGDVLLKFSEQKIKAAKDIYISIFFRKIKGYIWGFAIYPKKEGHFAVSFRSLPGGPNVSKLAKEYFNGGGHVLASGGTYFPTSEEKANGITAKEVCQKVIDTLKTAKIELTPTE